MCIYIALSLSLSLCGLSTIDIRTGMHLQSPEGVGSRGGEKPPRDLEPDTDRCPDGPPKRSKNHNKHMVIAVFEDLLSISDFT